jgi:hypothetical protein
VVVSPRIYEPGSLIGKAFTLKGWKNEGFDSLPGCKCLSKRKVLFMSKALNFINLTTEINPDDTTDMSRLGSFLLALSRTNLPSRGVAGMRGRIVPHGRDYKVVFDGGAVLARPSVDGAVLHRKGQCPANECTEVTWSIRRVAEFCRKHYDEFAAEEVA